MVGAWWVCWFWLHRLVRGAWLANAGQCAMRDSARAQYRAAAHKGRKHNVGSFHFIQIRCGTRSDVALPTRCLASRCLWWLLCGLGLACVAVIAPSVDV